MKLSKEELLKKISEAGFEDEAAISLMEDITDSWSDEVIEDRSEEIEQLTKDLEDLDTKYKDLLQKYKDRFLNIDVEEETEDDSEESEEVIDVKEI